MVVVVGGIDRDLTNSSFALTSFSVDPKGRRLAHSGWIAGSGRVENGLYTHSLPTEPPHICVFCPHCLGILIFVVSLWFHSGPCTGIQIWLTCNETLSLEIKGKLRNFSATMSLGKLPGIKGLVSGSQGKRRFKSDLSVDMISPPLGDFRHTMHVGRGGEVFGDTSFLSNYGGIREPGSPDSSKTTGFFTRTFRHVRKNSGPWPRGGSRDLSSPPPDVSPIIKNAISLPQLNVESPNGCLQRVLFPSSISSTDDSLYTYGEII